MEREAKNKKKFQKKIFFFKKNFWNKMFEKNFFSKRGSSGVSFERASKGHYRSIKSFALRCVVPEK